MKNFSFFNVTRTIHILDTLYHVVWKNKVSSCTLIVQIPCKWTFYFRFLLETLVLERLSIIVLVIFSLIQYFSFVPLLTHICRFFLSYMTYISPFLDKYFFPLSVIVHIYYIWWDFPDRSTSIIRWIFPKDVWCLSLYKADDFA